MQETNDKNEKSRGAVKKAEKALEEGFAEVKTPSQAAEVLDKIEHVAGDMEEQDLAAGRALPIQSNKLQPLTKLRPPQSPKERAAVVLTEAARKSPLRLSRAGNAGRSRCKGVRRASLSAKQSRRRSSAVETS